MTVRDLKSQLDGWPADLTVLVSYPSRITDMSKAFGSIMPELEGSPASGNFVHVVVKDERPTPLANAISQTVGELRAALDAWPEDAEVLVKYPDFRDRTPFLLGQLADELRRASDDSRLVLLVVRE